MPQHKIWAWGLLLIVLGLDGVACWAMLWLHANVRKTATRLRAAIRKPWVSS